jgi:uncharacterized protein YndB with AHSA1/START domain
MSDMASASFSITVDRAPEEVFTYLTDVRKHAEWSPKAYRVESLSDEPLHEGSTFTSYGWVPKDPEHRNEVTVTELRPSTRFTLHSTEPGSESFNRFVLTPVGGGTRIDRTMEVTKPPGLSGTMFPVILAALIKPGVNKGMNMLKANLDGR